jgi:tight adherence protein B
VSAAVAFAAAAAGLAVLALAELGSGAGTRARGLARAVALLADVVGRLGREGRDPRAAERRRLLLGGSLVALAAGGALAGPPAGIAFACAGPWLVSRGLRARRRRYRREVGEGVPAMAVAIADAIGGGHSLRAGLAEAAASVPGPAGHELRRAAAELAAGAHTEDALEAMRLRAPSPQLGTLVAACLLQRRAGGDLSRLLRDCARAFEDQARVEGEARTATAQARFTGLIVVLLPLGGALLAELASPGWLAGLWGSFLTAWLVGIALVLQATAAVLIRRFGQVRV